LADLLIRTKSGREIWVNVSTVRVTSRHKELSVLVHLFRDIDRQKDREGLVEQFLASLAKLAPLQEVYPPSAPSSHSPMADLTQREREVLRLLFSGSSTHTIARKLYISPATVRNHVNKTLAKLGVHSRLEAVTLAMRNGMI
jgi:DNA-binding NarL/FixJ family response regulator